MSTPQRLAALPAYIPSHNKAAFIDAAPGHKFLGYFRNWQGSDGAAFAPYKGKARIIGNPAAGQAKRDANDKLKAEFDSVLNEVCEIGSSSKAQIAALRARQQAHITYHGSNGYRISTKSTAPFATGLGNEHPIENGFAFHTPYGLPYLAGSGVKGILRRAMQELRDDGVDGFTDTAIDALFGPEKIDTSEDAKRGALDFWDVFPSPAGGKLVVEIMTPHYGGYYQKNETPHDSGAPVPVSFLAVPAKSDFDFSVVCQPQRLPESLQNQWRSLLDQAFAHAFEWVGFGAKTSVGYGAMQENLEARRAHEEQLKKLEQQDQDRTAQVANAAQLAQMSPLQSFIAQAVEERTDKNLGELPMLMGLMKQSKVPNALRTALIDRIRDLMVASKKWKEKSEKRNPEKDGDYQDTLKVQAWLKSQ
jgi:CRISPR-associated protein Cmr6